MTPSKYGQKTKSRKVTFTINAKDAKEVVLVGDFNHWDPKQHPMKKDGNGTWKKTMLLPLNQYEYKFLVDGVFKEDPCNDQTCLNCFGTRNSILILSAP